jgi:hypothetical protein
MEQNKSGVEQSLIFNDGTKCEDSHVMEMGPGLYINFGGGISMSEVLQILSDSERLSRIQYVYGKTKLVFEGYVKPVTINDEGTAITGILEKE